MVGAILQSHSVQLALSLDNTKPLDTDHFLNTLHESLNPIESEFFQRCEKNADEKETEGERFGFFFFHSIVFTLLKIKQ